MTSRSPNLLRAFLLAIGLFIGGMLGVSTYTLFHLRRDSIANGLDIAAMHTRGFEDFLTQSLHITEIVAANVIRPGSQAPSREEIEATFKATIERTPLFRSISLLDDDSRVAASSNVENVGKIVLTSDFLPPAAAKTPILRIGVPWAGRDFADGRPSSTANPIRGDDIYFIPILRSVFLGDRPLTLLIALNPDHVVNQIIQKVQPHEGSVEVLRYDGVSLIDSTPNSHPGTTQEGVIRALGLPQKEFGEFEQSTEDGRNTLSAFRASRLYPFIILTHLDRETALHRWQTEEQTLWTVVLPALIGITVFALLYYRRQIQYVEQRTRSERLERINAASVFTNAREGIMITDPAGVILDVNESFTRITGYSREEALGKNARLLRSGSQNTAFYEAMWRDLREKGIWAGELWNQRKNGDIYAQMLTITAVRDEHGHTEQYVGLFSDITDIKQHQQQLEFAARYDQLTRLPNRLLLADRMEQAMSQTLRRGLSLAVVFIDLDGFKEVNDTYGHEAGDHLLVALANQLKHALREGDTLGRIGGDEFVAILIDLPDAEASKPILARLLQAAAHPVAFSDAQLQVSASLGVAFYPQAEEVDANRLLRQADRAMYVAKQRGKNRTHMFHPGGFSESIDAPGESAA